MLRTPTVPLLLPEEAQLGASLTAIRHCLRCGVAYQDKNNLGQWRCSYHPCLYRADRRQQQRLFPCCGAPEGSRGCVRADHTCDRLGVGATDLEPPLRLSGQEARRLGLGVSRQAPGIEWNATEARLCIHRADLRDTSRRLATLSFS